MAWGQMAMAGNSAEQIAEVARQDFVGLIKHRINTPDAPLQLIDGDGCTLTIYPESEQRFCLTIHGKYTIPGSAERPERSIMGVSKTTHTKRDLQEMLVTVEPKTFNWGWLRWVVVVIVGLFRG